jgi:3-oxoacyl-[acyl-carrier protein] reductase
MRMVSLDHLTVMGASPTEFVHIAAESGYGAIGPIVGFGGNSGLPVIPLRDGEPPMCEIVAALRETGVIINTGSTSRFGHYGMANYSAAKEGVARLTRTVARDLGQFGVRCNMIRPISAITGTRTAGVSEMLRVSEELGQTLNWNRPLALHGVMPTPDHVAVLTVWLCGNSTKHVSGREFFVQGDEIGLMPETEMIRTVFAPDGFDIDKLNEPAITRYLTEDIKNRFLKTTT